MAFVGEAILSALFETLFFKLASSDLLKFARQEQVHAELKKWEKILLKIHAVLDDAEEKQMTDRLVKIWLDELRDLAYDVEDILDEFGTEALRRKLMAETEPSTSMVCSLIPSCCTSFNPSTVRFNVKMGSKIEEITARLQEISGQKNDLHLRENAGGSSYTMKSRLPTTSLVDESRVYGRETDKEAILNLLLKDEPSDDEVCVIPIVGMGGIGKTTLAQLAFNDCKVEDHFDLRAWVCVSDDFDVVRVTKTILQSVSLDTHDVNDLNLLQVMLKEKLSGNKFLLVLDDVWNENCEEWDILCSPMRAGAPGSKVIITTRNKGVASVAGTGSAYPLQELSHGDCLSLFTQQALGTRSFEAHPHLKELGEEIVRRCKGLPLAAKALGGMLRNEVNYDAWVNILKSKIWDLPQEKSSVLPALKLSYHHLPSNLKRCFAYCSIFPKDYEFDKDELILLWMAEGFLQQTKGEDQPEDLGAKYFCDLLSRSFFQQSSYNSSKFVMHDLINDLAHFVAGELCFNLDDKLENNEIFTSFEKARHSSFNRQSHEVLKKFETFYRVKFLRTLIALPINALSPSNFISPKVIHDLLIQKSCLRVLSLSGYRISELPNSIGDLRHLRYLNLSYSSIKRLPDSIVHLYNLQTLILRDCYRLTELPIEIGNLLNLRHLDITDTSQLLEMPSQIGSLTNLQTLSKFIVGSGSSLGIRELRNLLYLQGKLSISGLHNVVNVQDAKDANLADKQNIKELTMEWSNDFRNARNETEEMHVLESLQPHRNLKKLMVAFYGGSQLPCWIKEPSCPMMTHLILKNCKMCTSLPSLGRLPLLKDLHIEGLSKIMIISLEFYGESVKPFPSLEFLKFENMPKWKTWSFPDVDEEPELFPCLRELTIRKCPKLDKGLPNLPSLVTLDIFECPNLAVPFSRFASLRKLNAEECDKMILRSGVDDSGLTSWWRDGFGLENLRCLESAVIGRCHWIVSLEEQRLPCNLKILKIKDCANLDRLPNGLRSVEELSIERCPKLVSFLEMGFSPMLRYLLVRDCPSLICFPKGELPPALKRLEIHHCKNLTSLPEGTMHHNSNNTCCLQVLIIRNCSSLTSFPEGKLPSTLKRLEIRNCLKMEQISENMLQNNEALEELWISDCPGLESFIERGLPTPNLRQLKIVNCKNLKSLPPQIQNLTSLRALSIWDCPGVVSFPVGGLAPNLTVLEICDCENLKMPMSEWGLHSLTYLLRLLIRDVLPDMVSLSDSECLFPPSLSSLSISHMESLAFLNLQSLICLKELSFRGCPKLRYLGLPATVVSLQIKDCPMLKERCLKEKGEYWPNIAHIPCIQIDGSYIH